MHRKGRERVRDWKDRAVWGVEESVLSLIKNRIKQKLSSMLTFRDTLED